jgi:hypothetical protein
MMLAEGVRFELTRPLGLPVFKTGAINRSATPPGMDGQRPTPNLQRPTLNAENYWAFSVFWFEKGWTNDMFKRTLSHGAPEICPCC